MSKSCRAALLTAVALVALTSPPGRADSGSLPTAPVHTPKTASAFGIGDTYGLSPFWDWKTIETPHFRITYPVELDETARKSADYFEEAYALLTPRLQWSPRRTQILVIDNADSANGLTAAVQRFGIILYATPPDPFFSTAYYDDWLRLLVIHEYTHLVNMDTTTGFWAGLRIAIGDVLLPNSLWPTWMLEGLAVYMETRLTRSGRGRSPYYDMLLRTAVEAGTLGVSSSKPDYQPLDRINGSNPYFPGGETYYFYGYQLMNQVSLGRGDVLAGEAALGEMSRRSGHRIPYFINGNLQNITGSDWYTHWDQFIVDSKKRMESDLAKIRSQPLSTIDRLVDVSFGAQGVAASPDGRWLAYSLSSTERRQGLYLREIATGITRRLADKILGSGIAFTPDSRFILYSSLERRGAYRSTSDLFAYDLERGSAARITTGLRARDPSVSTDGKTVAFSFAANAGVGIAIAPLIAERGRLRVGDMTIIQEPSHLDRAANPVFTKDGTLVFSFHKNGENQDDLLSADLSTGKISTLVRNGRYNRWPAVSPVDGKIHYVSDMSGVDNIYRIDPPADPKRPTELAFTPVTNVTTGVWMPTLGPQGEIYASVFSINGWDLSRIHPLSGPIVTAAVSVSSPPAPPSVLDEAPTSLPAVHAPVAPTPKVAELYSATEAEAQDYSIWPSILPRQWFPLFYLVPGGAYFGGQVFGFDALDLHSYLVAGAWDTTVSKGDWIGIYWNRMFGPTLSLSGSQLTGSTSYIGTQLLSYERELDLSASISYPIRWTYSALTPQLSLNTERSFYYEPAQGSASRAVSRYVPSADFTLSYSDAESSRLAISLERGRIVRAGARAYMDSGTEYYKGIASWTEHIPTGAHTVLVPQVKGSMISRRNRSYLVENVVVTGKEYRLSDTLGGDDFDDVNIRGYAGRSFVSRSVLVPSLDFRFPVGRVFRGPGTFPLFMRDLYGFAFAEAAWFPGGTFVNTLPAAGGGLVLGLDAFLRVPLELAIEYHRSFRTQFAQRDQLLFSLSLGSVAF